jgi:hypothetical protein
VKRRRTAKRPGLDDVRYRTARAELKRIGSHICHTCRNPIDMQLKWPHPLSWSFDHLIPRSQLAPDDYRNWHISNGLEAHLHCNTSRQDKPAQPLGGYGLNTSIDW